jgi:hypothetical protein
MLDISGMSLLALAEPETTLTLRASAPFGAVRVHIFEGAVLVAWRLRGRTVGLVRVAGQA